MIACVWSCFGTCGRFGGGVRLCGMPWIPPSSPDRSSVRSDPGEIAPRATAGTSAHRAAGALGAAPDAIIRPTAASRRRAAGHIPPGVPGAIRSPGGPATAASPGPVARPDAGAVARPKPDFPAPSRRTTATANHPVVRRTGQPPHESLGRPGRTVRTPLAGRTTPARPGHRPAPGSCSRDSPPAASPAPPAADCDGYTIASAADRHLRR